MNILNHIYLERIDFKNFKVLTIVV